MNWTILQPKFQKANAYQGLKLPSHCGSHEWASWAKTSGMGHEVQAGRWRGTSDCLWTPAVLEISSIPFTFPLRISRKQNLLGHIGICFANARGAVAVKEALCTHLHGGRIWGSLARSCFYPLGWQQNPEDIMSNEVRKVLGPGLSHLNQDSALSWGALVNIFLYSLLWRTPKRKS